MRLVGDIALDAEVRAIASGAITDGEPVVVNSTGTVSGIITPASAAVGTEVLFHNSDNNDQASIFIPDTNKILIAYKDEGNSSYGTVRVATIDPSDNSVSYGSEIVFNSGQTSKTVATYDTNSDRIVIGYANSNVSLTGKAIVGTVSGSSVSFGTAVTFNDKITTLGVTFDSNSNKVVFGYEDANNSGHGTAIVGTVDSSDNSISFGSEAVYKAADTSNIGMCFDSNSNKVIIAYRHNADSSKGEAIVGTISGTSISYGSATVFNSVNTQQFDKSVVFDSSNNKVVIIYKDSGSGNTEALVGTVSGTSISFGSLATVGDSDGGAMSATFDSDNNNIILAYQDDGDDGNISIGTVSGTDISFNTPVEFASSAAITPMSIAYDPNTKRALITFADYDNSSHGFGIVFKNSIATNITTENYIGIANAAYADGQKATIKTTGSIARNIPQQPIASSAGTPVAFDSGRANETSIVYDPNVNRFLIAYKARDNSSYGTGVVATLSGTTLSFGTPVVFESAEAKGITPVFDTNTNKIVITYKDVGNSERGTAIVATIDSSDNSVTYGSPVVYHTSESSGSFRSAAFVPATVTNNDDSANSIVVAFKDGGDSGRGKAVVGVVSGAGNTSTTWGTVATFNSGSTDQDLTVVNDTNAKRLLIAYRDSGNSNYGTAVVATVNSSDSSITFGSETVFHSAETDEICGVFDPDTNKIILCFHDGADGNKSKSIVATISGTSVSFGSVVTVNTGGSYQNSVVYDTTANKAIVSMRDDTNSRGISFTGTVSGTDISYDSGVVFQGSTGGALDFVASAFDPDTSKVAIVYNLTTGKGVVHSPLADGDLTIGQQYFVQTDGTLGTSADDPSVIAGTAIGTSDIIVKG